MQADTWGVAHGFTDGDGSWVDANPATREAIRRSLGAPAAGDAPPADDGTRVVEAGHSVNVAQPTKVVLEDGTELSLAPDASTPADLPIGYHRLTDDDGSRALIVAPRSCVAYDAAPTWGWAVQLYAMRSSRSWGIGEFDDLSRLARWSAAQGSGMVLVNPLHAAAPVLSQQPSPYFPTSRCYRNPLYLTIEHVPGWSTLAAEIEPLAARARTLLAERRIDRDEVFRCKYAALELLWAQWRRAPRGAEHDRFDAYCRAEGEALRNFATFSAIVEERREAWMSWPEELRRPTASGVAAYRTAHEDRVAFHCWVQWLVDEQLAAAAPGLDLMTDLAIGVDRGGADAWCWQDSFALDMSVGAPPDSFNTQGQNWGLPPFDPWRLRAGGYEPFIRTVRSAFRHAKGLRMDHVMGLFRLYWIPDGASATDGCYVYTPFRDLLGIVAIESQRAGAYVVGEDLGTVEPYVREELAASRIMSYRLRQFEPGPSSEFPVTALAAVTTHDLPTIPGFWTRSDVTTQTEMGLAPNAVGTEEIRTRLAAWADVAPDAGPEALDDVVLGAYRDLATAPCAIITATLDDALGVEERPNMPGTIDEWPNWRIALPVLLDDALADPRVAAVAEVLRR